MRCGILSLLQESNTFLPQLTTLADFEADVLVAGEPMRAQFENAPHELGGFFEGLTQNRIEAVPLLAARAVPYGVIAGEAFEQLMSQMFSALERAGRLDGVLVAPHGATVSETAPDADGYWLTELRRRVGPDVPIIGTIDPHANLSASIVAACDALIAYRTNPHVDQRRRGLEAAQLMSRTLRGDVRPTQAASYPPLAIGIDAQATGESPCRELFAGASQLAADPSVLAASIVLGFPYADVREMGSSALVVTDDNVQAAEGLSQRLGEEMWRHRRQFAVERLDVERAIRQAEALPKPVCLLDMGDNVGGGSPGDGVWIAEALLAQRGIRSLAVICDAHAAERARRIGVGNNAVLELGACSGAVSGRPLSAQFRVVSLHEGVFTETQAVHGGFTHFDQGPTAVVASDAGLTVIITSRRTPPFSLAQITSCNLNPASFDMIAAKGVNAPIAAYSKVCTSFVRVNTPGYTAADMTTLEYRHRRQPMYPFEPEAEWESADTPSQARR
jgi:microcystin degradation protein MlrC